jgi:hypothetical protein
MIERHDVHDCGLAETRQRLVFREQGTAAEQEEEATASQ